MDQREEFDRAVWMLALERTEKRTNLKRTQKPSAFLPACEDGRERSVIKALTASDNDVAPFCCGPIPAKTGIQNGPGCHVEG